MRDTETICSGLTEEGEFAVNEITLACNRCIYGDVLRAILRIQFRNFVKEKGWAQFSAEDELEIGAFDTKNDLFRRARGERRGLRLRPDGCVRGPVL